MTYSKLVLMIVLCAFSFLLTYYFHGILKISTVFTHFFYIPIILSALWWPKRGVLVAAFLGLVLLSANIVYGSAYMVSPYNNYFRFVMFVSVSIFVSILTEKIAVTRAALQAQKDKLEIIVAERTQDLASANRQLNEKMAALRRAHAEIAKSEAQVRHIIEASPVGIFIIQNGCYGYVNAKFAEIFGWETTEAIIEKPLESLFDPEYGDLLRNRSAERLAGKPAPTSYELVAVKRSGMKFDAAVWLTTINYQERMAILGFLVDMSLPRKMQEQILQSQKMDSIGVLAGGIAHVFNNALMVISGSVDLIEKSFKSDASKMEGNIKRIMASVQQMVNLNKMLLAYARKGPVWLREAQLNNIVEETLTLVRYQEKISCTVETVLAPDLPTILTDKTQMQIIITAILKNALEAIHDEGTITIRTYSQNIIGDVSLAASDLAEGRYACLEITDTGVGMEAETLEHVYEPFFTTHFQGRGLGMAAVYGIVKDHKGAVQVVSKPGEGTTVIVYLPVMAHETAAG